MKTNAAVLAIASIFLINSFTANAASGNDAAKNRAVTSCSELSKHEAKSWSMWAASKGMTKSELAQTVYRLCLSGLMTAEDSDRAADIDEWQIAMFNKVSSMGLDPLNVNAVQKSTYIAKTYFSVINKK